MRFSLAMSSGLLVLALAAGVSAQRRPAGGSTPSGPTSEQLGRARSAYAEGQTAFRAGRLEEAEAAFRRAFEAVPNPVVLLSIAETQERRSMFEEAAQTLERYLTERTDAPDRTTIEERIRGLRGRPGTIAVASEPPGAAISLDGQATGHVTPADVEASAGEHTIGLALAGFAAGEARTTVPSGGRTSVSVALVGEASVAPPEPPPAESQPSGGNEPGVGVWIAAGVGGAALIAGTVFGFLALSSQSSFDSMPRASTADEGERWAVMTDVMFGVAVAAGATALVLFLTGAGSSSSSDEPASARGPQPGQLTIAPWISPTSGGIGANLRL